MAGRVGDASIGPRLFPAAPGASVSAVPRGNPDAQALDRALERTSPSIHEGESVVIG